MKFIFRVCSFTRYKSYRLKSCSVFCEVFSILYLQFYILAFQKIYSVKYLTVTALINHWSITQWTHKTHSVKYLTVPFYCSYWSNNISVWNVYTSIIVKIIYREVHQMGLTAPWAWRIFPNLICISIIS